MKKYIFLLICAIVAIIPASAIASADTVFGFDRPDSVTIISSDNSLSVKVVGDRYGERFQYDYHTRVDSADNTVWNINLPFTKSESSRSGRSRFSIDWCDNIYIGGTIPLDHEPGIRGGWEIGIDNIFAVCWRPARCGTALSLGFGMGYRSANVGGGRVIAMHDKILSVDPAGEGIDKASSRLHLLRFHVPLMITQRIYKDFKVRVGGILNLNTYMSATTKTQSANVTSKSNFHSLHQRFLTADLFGSLNFIDGMGVYVRWSPMQVFDNGWGPKFEALSVGVNFIL